MRKVSLSELGLLKGPPDAILVSVVHTAAPDLSKDLDPYGLMHTDDLVMSLSFAALERGASG